MGGEPGLGFFGWIFRGKPRGGDSCLGPKKTRLQKPKSKKTPGFVFLDRYFHRSRVLKKVHLFQRLVSLVCIHPSCLACETVASNIPKFDADSTSLRRWCSIQVWGFIVKYRPKKNNNIPERHEKDGARGSSCPFAPKGMSECFRRSKSDAILKEDVFKRDGLIPNKTQKYPVTPQKN